jgi:hypothetical protein
VLRSAEPACRAEGFAKAEGALHSALLAPADVDAGNGLYSSRAWQDATPLSACSTG